MAKKIRVKSLIDAHSQMAGMRDGLLREYGRYNREFGAFDAPSRKTKTAKGKEFWAKMDRLGGAYDRTTGVIKANLKKSQTAHEHGVATHGIGTTITM